MPSQRTAGRLLAVSLPLYLVWELLQMSSYVGVSTDRVVEFAACLLATAMDGLMMLALLGAGWAAFRERRWYRPPRVLRYAVVSLVGLGQAGRARGRAEFVTAVRAREQVTKVPEGLYVTYALMTTVSQSLSDEDFENLVHFIAAVTPAAGPATRGEGR